MTNLGYEWRYLSTGKVKHALSDSTARVSRCGTGPVWFSGSGWLGTGNQGEYETAERLPECRRCARLLAEDTGTRHEDTRE